jgi:hypothetical protein
VLQIEKTKKRINKNVRLTPEAAQLVDDLAKAYNTTAGKAMEAMLETYAPGLIRSAEEEKK